MHDSFLVGRLEALGNLQCNGQGLLEGHRTLRESLREGLALGELHDQEAHRSGRSRRRLFLEPVDGGDAGVVERRKKLRLAFHPRKTLGVARQLVREHLDCHLPTQALVLRTEHLAHATLADLGENAVMAQSCVDPHAYSRRSFRGGPPPWSGEARLRECTAAHEHAQPLHVGRSRASFPGNCYLSTFLR